MNCTVLCTGRGEDCEDRADGEEAEPGQDHNTRDPGINTYEYMFVNYYTG